MGRNKTIRNKRRKTRQSGDGRREHDGLAVATMGDLGDWRRPVVKATGGRRRLLGPVALLQAGDGLAVVHTTAVARPAAWTFACLAFLSPFDASE